MLDVQDIDALLIGALYGELTPADEARLAVHLESHPTDRTALDDLTHARTVVRESRILQFQYEPPQAISALLLQEAARRAPKKVAPSEEKESWFHRFVHSFMSHPAMAAAAMLVLVVGVAGTLYLKHDKQFADESAPARDSVAQTIAPTEPATQEIAAGAAGAKGHDRDQNQNDDGVAAHGGYYYGAQGSAAAAAPATGSGSAYNADLAEDSTGKRVGRKDAVNSKLDEGGKSGDRFEQQKQKNTAHEGVVVHTPPALVPREIPTTEAKRPPPKVAVAAGDSETKPEIARAENGRGNSPGGPPAADPTANAITGSVASPPPPQQSPSATPPATPTAPPAATVRERTADKPSPDNAESTLVGWAKDQHLRVQAFVKAGKCQDAAKLALDISSKAPDYYAQFVATDRALKACASYINDARDKEAEKSQKSRAQKRVNANEPAPARLDVK